jgi:hypothetical protein
MAKKKYILTTEFDHDYTLIVIKSVLEDYRLAYFLNKAFNLHLKKEDFKLNFDHKKGDFSVFGFDDLSTNSYWSLIANKQVINKEVKTDNYNLFDEISNTFILLPEEKKADYFLKIENNTQEITTIIKKVNTIHRVITSYEINPNDLKSKDLLIF